MNPNELTKEQKELLSEMITTEFHACEWYESEKENNLIHIAEKLKLKCLEDLKLSVSK